MKPILQAFTVKSNNGLLKELRTDIGVQNSLLSLPPLLKQSAIWDTGATSTCINTNLVQSLKLQPTGVINVQGANSVDQSFTYIVNLILPNGITVQELNVIGCNLGPATTVLVGMDIISLGDFAISSVHGASYFSFSLPAYNKAIDFVQRATKANPKNVIVKQI